VEDGERILDPPPALRLFVLEHGCERLAVLEDDDRGALLHSFDDGPKVGA